MAMAALLEGIVRFIANHLKCPICFELFTEPVTLPCGHSYCFRCIEDHLKCNVRRDCPECRAELRANYKPHKNVTINAILELPHVVGRETWDSIVTGSEEDFTPRESCSISGNTRTAAEAVEVSNSLLECIGGCDSAANNSVPPSVTQSDEDVITSDDNSEENSANVSEDPDFSDSGTSAAPLHADFISLSFSPHRGHSRLEFFHQRQRMEVRSLPLRTHCSYFDACQWIAEQQFITGRHFWDVETNSCSGWAAGVAYTHLEKGERLGRSESSWCIAWSNNRFSAWHNNAETELKHRPPNRLRVLLDMDARHLSFWNGEDGEAELYHVQVEFRHPVSPIFWLLGTKPGNALSFPKY